MNANKINKILMGAVVALLLGFLVFGIVRSVKNYNTVTHNQVVLVENTRLANTVSDKNKVSGSLILPSNDNKYGSEMAYSFWIYLNSWEDKTNPGNNNNLSHVFHKGDQIALPSQSPGIWLGNDNNSIKMVIKMNTFHVNPRCVDGSNNEMCWLEKCEFDNIPVKKWVHFSVVIINKNIDIYVNGFLKKRCILKGIPRLNQGDVYIAQTANLNGFDGYISRLKYYNYALPIWQIERGYQEGPSKEMDETVMEVVPPYLSRNWWLRKFII